MLGSNSIDISPVMGGLRNINENICQTNENIFATGEALSGLTLRVHELAAQQKTILDTVSRLGEEFTNYVLKDALNSRLQQAKSDLQQRTLEFEHEFGRHRRARALATGLLDALTSGTVQKDLIGEATADELMADRHFWLPPALHALGCWISNRPSVAERAVIEAITRDNAKTSLFFALICRRFDRHEASQRWLARYLECSDPSALNRDMIVMLNTMAAGVFGAGALRNCSEICRKWFEELALEPGYRDAQVKRWSSSLDNISPEIPAGDYPMLRSHSKTWIQLEKALSRARRHSIVLHFLRDVFEGNLQIPVRLTDEVDNLLDSLVRDHHPDELPARREILRLQCIIEAGGNGKVADTLLGERDATFDAQQDLAALLSNMAMFPDQTKATTGAQRYAFAWCKEYFIEACEALAARDRAAVPNSIHLRIGDWEATTADGTAVAEHERLLRAHCDAATAAKTSGFQVPPVAFMVVLGCAALWFWAGVSSGFGIAAIIVGIVIFTVMQRQTGQQRSRIRDACELDRERAVKILYSSFAEITDLRKEIEREDAKLAEISKFMEGVSPDQYIRTMEGGTRTILVTKPT